MDEFQWAKSFQTASYGTICDTLIPAAEESLPERTPASRGSFAPFVCHVASLEKKLKSISPIVLDTHSIVKETGRNLGEGTTFMVRHAHWVKDPNEPPLDVALKEIIADVNSSRTSSSEPIQQPQSDWKDILFEIRALLHEPIRYHPNLVRLLGIQWGLSAMSESAYPMLIMEYGSVGTFDALQASSEPLSFPVIQKLCYDIGRALSALHACGIVHGDVKHENVLIFPSKSPVEGDSYTAKLADFGGTVMDLTPSESRRMLTWTWPFQAPEVSSRTQLTKVEMMSTDTYSFGLLLWRAFADGQGFITLSGATQNASALDKAALNAKKASKEFTNIALADLTKYAVERSMPSACCDLFVYAILHTVRLKPGDRDLAKAQAALRGIKLGHMKRYLNLVEQFNIERTARKARNAPGAHGITIDAASLYLAREHGHDADLQHNIPGNRPQLEQPDSEEFSFEPERLKHVLTWDQQVKMVEEMKNAASNTKQITHGIPELRKTVAAFYVFQCYLFEFGATFNADEAVEWLRRASEDQNSHDDADYLAQAWLWRMARALGVRLDVETHTLISLLRISVIRGHRNCLQDLLAIAESTGDVSLKDLWLSTHSQCRYDLFSMMGGVGMGYFFPSFMTPPWNTADLWHSENIHKLDEKIQGILGDEFGSCLNSRISPNEPITQTRRNGQRNPFDCIYVNRRGHGLLHCAAARGAVDSLRHLITTYDCDIDVPNHHVDETPLLCAAAGGKFDCVLLLLESGADPNGHRHGQENPLHWLSSFSSTEMEPLASRLVAAGADLELRSGGMRHDIRGVRADWEQILTIPTTPLGRAVLMNNLDAVKVLLKLGADPLTKHANKHRAEWEDMKEISKLTKVSSPFELAAVLTFPEILATFIKHLDPPDGMPKRRLLNVDEMLDLAHGIKVTIFDPLSVQSRLVRCGAHHKRSLQITLALLYAHSKVFGDGDPMVKEQRSRVLSREVGRGDVDAVDCLLNLGYPVNGTSAFRPLEEAIRINNLAIFELLRSYKADLTVTRMTPTGAISLLHICASRPRQSRPGRTIADALIAAGVPVESTDARSRPPLATAIVHHNFDVAAALLEAGANIDATYPIRVTGPSGPETKEVTVLVEILSQHTMHTLESLKFLFDAYKDGLAPRPAFIVDSKADLSILHLLAGSLQYTHIAQITPKILNLCLETYSESDLINYKHSIFGTPLYYAAANGHKAMVERLLDRGANVTCDAGPDLNNSVQTFLRSRETWTPLWAAILRLDDEMKKCMLFPPAGAPGTWLGSNMIRNLERTVELLLERDDDSTAREAVKQLERRKNSLHGEARAWKLGLANKRRELKMNKDERPIDLSVLGDSSSTFERRIREVCGGPEEEWKTEELGRFFEHSEAMKAWSQAI